MKAHLIDTHLVPRSRSSAKVKVKYQGHVSQKMGVLGGISVSQTHLFFFCYVFKNLFPIVVKVGIAWQRVKFLLNGDFLDTSKLKAFANNKINVTEKLKFVLGRIENIVGKGVNATHQHYLLSLNVLKKLLF